VLRAIYRPSAYFARTRRLGRMMNRPQHGGAGLSREAIVRDVWHLGYFVWVMMRKQPLLLPHFLKTFADCAWHNPAALKYIAMMMGLYLHMGPFARIVIGHIERQIAMIDRGDWKAPPLVPTNERDSARPEAVAAGRSAA
jgi:hypothetical protein